MRSDSVGTAGDRRPLALAGFMGAGKTSTGRLLAAALGRPFHDTDEEVERASGRAVVSFFPAEEPAFRRLEAEAVARLVAAGPSVIALGGGALLDPGTRALLREHALLIHLRVAWAELEPEIPTLLATRPLLRGRTPAELRALYEARLEVYGESHLEVRVGRQGPEQAAAAVLRALGPAAPGGRSPSPPRAAG